MTAAAVRPTTLIPSPRAAADSAPVPAELAAPRDPSAGRAAAYQRVLHQLVRRELRLLSDLAAWASPDDGERIETLTRHSELISRVLLHHHAVEREAVWPALLRAVPRNREDEVRAAVVEWTDRCARMDHLLRDLTTAARQWEVARTDPARESFATACAVLAVTVETQTADEEAVLLPLLDRYLHADDWAAIAHSSHCKLSGREQLLVLGLALEDSCAGDRARLLGGLSPSARVAWRLHGRRNYRAAVVKLRGAPPAS